MFYAGHDSSNAETDEGIISDDLARDLGTYNKDWNSKNASPGLSNGQIPNAFARAGLVVRSKLLFTKRDKSS